MTLSHRDAAVLKCRRRDVGTLLSSNVVEKRLVPGGDGAGPGVGVGPGRGGLGLGSMSPEHVLLQLPLSWH